jgi:ATP adenylyltransferase
MSNKSVGRKYMAGNITCLFVTYRYNPRETSEEINKIITANIIGLLNFFEVEGQIIMEAVYAPWRSAYIRGKKPSGCIFCQNSLRDDDFVLWEGKSAYVIMNRHLGKIHDLTPEEKVEIFDLVDLCLKVLTEIIKPDGFNLGMNLGKVAGAGVDDHIHIHIVPRWNGDTNFMTVTGETRVVSEDITQTRKNLLPCFERISLQEG